MPPPTPCSARGACLSRSSKCGGAVRGQLRVRCEDAGSECAGGSGECVAACYATWRSARGKKTTARPGPSPPGKTQIDCWLLRPCWAPEHILAGTRCGQTCSKYLPAPVVTAADPVNTAWERHFATLHPYLSPPPLPCPAPSPLHPSSADLNYGRCRGDGRRRRGGGAGPGADAV